MPRADELGLTLRDRMWLTRAALATMAVCFAVSLVLLTMVPPEQVRPTGALQTQLAQRALAPIAVEHRAVASLPASVVQRAVAIVDREPAPAVTVVERPIVSSRPTRHVTISRGGISASDLPVAPAVDLSRPQPLAPPKHVEPEPRVEEQQSRSVAVPLPEPELKRPSFE